MGQVIIRNLDDAALENLRADAQARGVSLEQELRDLINKAGHRKDYKAKIRDLQIRLAGRGGPDSVTLLREDRDR